ncbi:nucleic acid-binding, OB-fold protein [Artemisia annua]|uniref:Nucleic acid-binding, OB-fold protein n=1 Tax=Artemisia annua TaxID=35608 RepID=A0A2U1KM69_ARTAN|nr:nucleic acid-binding, OB-fold protein [Artemisia annua]
MIGPRDGCPSINSPCRSTNVLGFCGCRFCMIGAWDECTSVNFPCPSTSPLGFSSYRICRTGTRDGCPSANLLAVTLIATQFIQSLLRPTEIVALADIKPTDIRKAIKVKLYHKWTAKRIPELNQTIYCCILLDKRGVTLEASIHLLEGSVLCYTQNGLGTKALIDNDVPSNDAGTKAGTPNDAGTKRFGGSLPSEGFCGCRFCMIGARDECTSVNFPCPSTSPLGFSSYRICRTGTRDGCPSANLLAVTLIAAQFIQSLLRPTAYLIRGFGCQKTERWQQTLSNKITLLFGKYTEIIANGFPEHYFEFAAYNELGKIADDKDSGLTDYIGYVRTIYEKRTTGDATTNIVTHRNIELQNLNGNSVTLTMWNDMATSFQKDLEMAVEQPIVVATKNTYLIYFMCVVFLNVPQTTGGIQLSATPTTHHYINPNLPETKQIHNVYNELLRAMPLLQVQPYRRPNVEEDKYKNRVSLKTLLEINPEGQMCTQLYTGNESYFALGEVPVFMIVL